MWSAPGRGNDLAGRQARRHRHSASLLAAGTWLPRRRQLPRLHGGNRGRARAHCILHTQAYAEHGGEDRDRSRRKSASDGHGAIAGRSAAARGFTGSRVAILALGRGSRNIDSSRFPAHDILKPDLSHPAMAVNLDACIDCGLCVRACREVQVNDVIGMGFRNIDASPVFDFDDPMGLSTCVACGECVQACPTGALMPKSIVDPITQHGSREVDREVHSVCPYCGVGCQISYQIKDNTIAFVQGRERLLQRESPVRQRPVRLRLCEQSAAADEAFDPQAGLAKASRCRSLKPAQPFPRGELGGGIGCRGERVLRVSPSSMATSAIAGFGSAKCTNEEAYLFQKLIRTRFRNNNIDHCTRLCHASSVAALIEGIGSGAVTATFNEVEHADVIMIIGANPTENHPVAATFFKQAAKRGATLIVIDPRGSALREYATYMLRFKPASDVALLNAIMHVIVEEKLYDVQYLQAHTENFERLKEHLVELQPGIGSRYLRHRRRYYPQGRAAPLAVPNAP